MHFGVNGKSKFTDALWSKLQKGKLSHSANIKLLNS